MTLAHGYGVAIGSLVSFTREDPNNFGHWYHGKLRLGTPAGEYEAALDVDTPSGVGVSYRLVTGLSPSDLASVVSLASGFTALSSTASSGALDYVRSPLLQDGWLGRWRLWPYAVAVRRRLAGSRQDARAVSVYGAVACETASGALSVWQIKFNPQSLHTDAAGLPQ